MKRKYTPVKQYKPKYANPNDPTSLNYLALAAAILDKNYRNDRGVEKYLRGLIDKEESSKRIKQIDEDRSKGILTEAEYLKINDENEEYRDLILEQIEQYKRKHKNIRKSKACRVTNKFAGTQEIFGSLKDACEEYDLKYSNVKARISQSKSVHYKGLEIEYILI